MYKWLRRFTASAAAALSLVALAGVALACASPIAPQESPPAATPDTQATIAALAQRPGFSAPTPTPVPAGVLQSAQEFSRGLDSVNQSWDQLHRSYDEWQAGLIACDPRSVRASLNQFNGRFAQIVQSAKALGRTGATRDLADRVISAAEAEQQALRALRDNHGSAGSPNPAGRPQVSASGGSRSFTDDDNGPAKPTPAPKEPNPGSDTGGGSGRFAEVDQLDQARSESSATLHEVSDALADLKERNTEAGRDRLEEFTEAFHAVNGLWEDFHLDYDDFRSREVELSSSEVVSELSSLIYRFSKVARATRELPYYQHTQPVAELMADTANKEDLALRSLRATFQKEPQESSGSAANAPGSPVPTPTRTSEPSNGDRGKRDPKATAGAAPPTPRAPAPTPTPTPPPKAPEFVPMSPELFLEFEAELVEANAARREASAILEQLSLSFQEGQLQSLAGFTDEFQALLAEWNSFDKDYETWQANEGGCDRRGAVNVLLEMGAGYNDLAAEVGELPNTLALRPLGELLVEAVRRESSALDDLKDRWRPFDAGIYQPLGQERAAADNQRRQVAVGIQDLLERYGLNAN